MGCRIIYLSAHGTLSTHSGAPVVFATPSPPGRAYCQRGVIVPCYLCSQSSDWPHPCGLAATKRWEPNLSHLGSRVPYFGDTIVPSTSNSRAPWLSCSSRSRTGVQRERLPSSANGDSPPLPVSHTTGCAHGNKTSTTRPGRGSNADVGVSETRKERSYRLR